MAVSKRGIQKIVQPYLYEENGYSYIPRDKLAEVQDAISSQYINLYVTVEDCGNGVSRLKVGNLTSKVKKPIYEGFVK